MKENNQSAHEAALTALGHSAKLTTEVDNLVSFTSLDDLYGEQIREDVALLWEIQHHLQEMLGYTLAELMRTDHNLELKVA